MKKQSMKKQGGYTLVELTIGITVVAITLAGIITAGRKMSRDILISQFISELESGMKGLQSLTATLPNTNGVDLKTAAAAGLFPNGTLTTASNNSTYFENMRMDGVQWVVGGASQIGTTSNYQGLYLLLSVPASAPDLCIYAISALAPLAHEVYSTGDNVIKKAGYGTAIDMGVATTRCQAGIGNITYIFNRR